MSATLHPSPAAAVRTGHTVSDTFHRGTVVVWWEHGDTLKLSGTPAELRVLLDRVTAEVGSLERELTDRQRQGDLASPLPVSLPVRITNESAYRPYATTAGGLPMRTPDAFRRSP